MLEIQFQNILNSDYASYMSHNRIEAFGGMYSPDELEFINQILVEVCRQGTKYCAEHDKSGFSVSIALDSRIIITTQVGNIEKEDSAYGPDGKRLKYADFSEAKVWALQNSSSTRSSRVKGKYTTIKGEPVVGGGCSF